MAFKRWQKSPSKKPPVKSWEPEEMKIIGWCLNKGIGVGISPDWKNDLNRWQIEISINGNVHTDPNRYEDEVVLNKVVEYYNYYYNKYNTNTNNK
jgi:hypothetical protein|tara:strand:+ start:57 stop:341 length:285 start_codon:yes stop_codon:yes gene_type:complete